MSDAQAAPEQSSAPPADPGQATGSPPVEAEATSGQAPEGQQTLEEAQAQFKELQREFTRKCEDNAGYRDMVERINLHPQLAEQVMAAVRGQPLPTPAGEQPTTGQSIAEQHFGGFQEDVQAAMTGAFNAFAEQLTGQIDARVAPITESVQKTRAEREWAESLRSSGLPTSDNAFTAFVESTMQENPGLRVLREQRPEEVTNIVKGLWSAKIATQQHQSDQARIASAPRLEQKGSMGAGTAAAGRRVAIPSREFSCERIGSERAKGNLPFSPSRERR